MEVLTLQNWNHFYLHEDTQLGNFKLEIIGSVSKTLSNICLKTFFQKRLEFVREVFSQKISIIDIWQGPKYFFKILEAATRGVLYKKAAFKNFAIFTGKQLRWSLLAVRSVTLLNKAHTYIEEHLGTAASGSLSKVNQLVFLRYRHTCFVTKKTYVCHVGL